MEEKFDYSGMTTTQKIAFYGFCVPAIVVVFSPLLAYKVGLYHWQNYKDRKRHREYVKNRQK